MSAGLPTIRELIAEGAATLPEPFSRAALINWVSARRPDVGVPSIATHIQLATHKAGSPPTPTPGPAPLLHRVARGRYLRYRGSAGNQDDVAAAGRAAASWVVLVGSCGPTAATAAPAGELFRSEGFARVRDAAVRSGVLWFVLSAKHGLLEPHDVVAPYDIRLGDASTVYRTAWGEWVAAQLGERVQLAGATVEVHGGVDFAQPLRQPLARRSAALELPLPGSWREADVSSGGSLEAPDRSGTPVGTALGRLRGLVAGHRSREGGSAQGVDTSTP